MDLARLGLAPLLLASGAACDPSMNPTDYDRDCAADDDCVAVEFEDVCACPDGAINKRDEPRYVEERNKKRLDVCDQSIETDCAPADAVCADEQCEIAE